MNNKVILGHPFGNANVRQALRALSDFGILETFVTTVCAEKIPFLSLFPSSIRGEIQRRSFSVPAPDRIRSHPVVEVTRLFGIRLGRTFPTLKRFTPTVDDVWRTLDAQLANEVIRSTNRSSTVYAYEDGAFATFTSNPHIRKLYELPIGYWKNMHSLLREESMLQPAWASTLKGLSDAPEKLEKKEIELELANKIIVPSDFVKSTLPAQWSAKSAVVPYGCPPSSEIERQASRVGTPLRILFCGSLGQRKGISYLFEAVKRMGSRALLTVVGSETAPSEALNCALQGVTWYRSLSHPRVLELMRGHDVFLFPTLFEGRALVVLEALSQGLPVITTTHSGASDVVVDGRSGFLVPIRSVESIVQALDTLYDDRDLLHYMSEQAQEISSKATWPHIATVLSRPLQPDLRISKRGKDNSQQPFLWG